MKGNSEGNCDCRAGCRIGLNGISINPPSASTALVVATRQGLRHISRPSFHLPARKERNTNDLLFVDRLRFIHPSPIKSISLHGRIA